MTINNIYWAKEVSTRFPTHGAGTVTVSPPAALGLRLPDLPAGQAHCSGTTTCRHQPCLAIGACTRPSGRVARTRGVPTRNGPFSYTPSPSPSNPKAARDHPTLAKC